MSRSKVHRLRATIICTLFLLLPSSVRPESAAGDSSVSDFEQSIDVEPEPDEPSVDRPSFLAKLHPVVVHFPIAWTLLAALTQFGGFLLARQRQMQLAHTFRSTGAVVLPLALLSCGLAVASGLAMASGNEVPDAEVLRHRNLMWIATGLTGLWGIATYFHERSRSISRWWGRLQAITALGACSILVYGAHLGALLTRGPSYWK